MMTKGKAMSRRRAVRRTRHALNRAFDFLTHASMRKLSKRAASHPVRSMVRERTDQVSAVFRDGRDD